MGAPQRGRVLVVDDEADFASALALRLDRRGYSVRAAFSGEEAVGLFSPGAWDAVVLDLKMPGMDGLATLREVRRIDPAVAVVVLTGHGSVRSGIDGMRLGAADFIQKPVAFDALCTAIDAAVERALAERMALAERTELSEGRAGRLERGEDP